MCKIKRIKALILAIAFTSLISQFKVSAQSSLGNPRVNVNANKEWTVKFSRALNPSTVNSSNISVTHVVNGKNDPVPVMVTLGSDPNIAIVSPVTGGYEPGEKYNLTISGSIESASGKKLNNPVTLQFTTDNAYSDGTNYLEFPNIASNKFEYTPLLSSQKQGFFLSSNNGTSVQYRVFVNAQNEPGETYTELTNGYTSSENGKIAALKILSSGSNGEKYKVIIYVKRAGVQGAHRDANTDYDNYYIDYFRCVDSIGVNSGDYVNYNLSLDNMVNTQINLDSNSTPVFVATNVMDNAASKNQIKYYVNPDNFLDSYGKYQFLKLTYTNGITADSLNNFLKGKGIFEGMGQSFLNAAKVSNINVAYLVSHAMLETGNGTSQLANGGARDTGGKYIYGKAVYNFFGIGAIDNNAVANGTKTAYENGWDTPEKALSGGAKWIAAQYINNPSYNQNTLYKMRWDPANPGQHQYATDIAWAYKQISNIKSVQDILSSGSDADLKFEVPRLK